MWAILFEDASDLPGPIAYLWIPALIWQDLARFGKLGVLSFPNCLPCFPPKDESLKDYSGFPASEGDVRWLRSHQQVHFLAL